MTLEAEYESAIANRDYCLADAEKVQPERRHFYQVEAEVWDWIAHDLKERMDKNGMDNR